MRRMYSKNQLDQEVQNVVSSGELENVKVFENIVDKYGHKRFIEGNLSTIISQEGTHIAYAKWSLSGTHLMLVVAGTFDDEVVIANGTTLAEALLPNWILDKIYNVWANQWIERKTITLVADDWSTQTMTGVLGKFTNRIAISLAGGVTMTATRSFRIQYDLLIDNE